METQEAIHILNLTMQLVNIHGLEISPVGVRFINSGTTSSFPGEQLQQHRYRQALMKARRGEKVILDNSGIACPAAAFGFRPLPEALRSGQGLVGFGIVSDPSVGQRMSEGMSDLKMGSIQQLELFPLEQAVEYPDVIVIKGPVEPLMWINMAYLYATGSERVQGTSAILQAT